MARLLLAPRTSVSSPRCTLDAGSHLTHCTQTALRNMNHETAISMKLLTGSASGILSSLVSALCSLDSEDCAETRYPLALPLTVFEVLFLTDKRHRFSFYGFQ